MQMIIDLIRWFFANLDILLGAVLPIIAVLKLTAWGRANAEALDTLTRVIEDLDAKDVKTAMAAKESQLSDVARDVLRDAVATVDIKKRTPIGFDQIGRELWRGIFPVK